MAETALGYSREDNTHKLITWLTQIANDMPDIISIEILIADPFDESAGNLILKVIYANPKGLERVRADTEHKHFYHMGLRCKTVSRNTLTNANRVRPWEVFADLAISSN